MDLVAGPQGSGKSTFFPVGERGFGDHYNIDDERKRLNRGSAQNIPESVSAQALAGYVAFIEEHIRARRSFSIEVTLAREITFEQARRAQANGFLVQLTYLSAPVDECVRRVRARVQAGGHGLPEVAHKRSYADSTANLRRALARFDIVEVYDASVRARLDEPLHLAIPRRVLAARWGEVAFRDPDQPPWLADALQGSPFAR